MRRVLLAPGSRSPGNEVLAPGALVNTLTELPLSLHSLRNPTRITIDVKK